MKSPVEAAITKETKVSVGVLIALIAVFLTLLGFIVASIGAFSELNANVKVLGPKLDAVEQAVDRNTQQLASDGRAMAVLQTLVTTQTEKLKALEIRVQRLEQR